MKVQRLTALLALLLGLVVLAFVLAGVPETGTAPSDAGTTAPPRRLRRLPPPTCPGCRR